MTALLMIIIFLLVAVDQLTKFLMLSWLQPLETVEIIPKFIRFRFVLNNGAAFSMLANARWLFVGVTSVCIIVCIAALCSKRLQFRFSALQSPVIKAALVLITAGGTGNLIDRIFRGLVVDFIEPVFVDFAVFNFADILVTVGTFIIVLYLIYDVINDFKKKKS